MTRKPRTWRESIALYKGATRPVVVRFTLDERKRIGEASARWHAERRHTGYGVSAWFRAVVVDALGGRPTVEAPEAAAAAGLPLATWLRGVVLDAVAASEAPRARKAPSRGSKGARPGLARARSGRR